MQLHSIVVVRHALTDTCIVFHSIYIQHVVVAVEGRCDDYNKSNRHASLCVYVQSQDYSTPGSGMTCSNKSKNSSIAIITQKKENILSDFRIRHVY